MTERSYQQRTRVLRDDADRARSALDASLVSGRSGEDRDESLRRAHAHAMLALAESFDRMASVLDAIAGEVGREWMQHKYSRAERAERQAPRNGASATGGGRKM